MLCLNTFFTTYYLENIQTTLVYRFFLLFFSFQPSDLSYGGHFQWIRPKSGKHLDFISRHQNTITSRPCVLFLKGVDIIKLHFYFQINYITFCSSIHEICSIKQNEKSCNISIYTSSLKLLLINWSIFPITF